MGYREPNGYTLPILSYSTNLADSTTYYCTFTFQGFFTNISLYKYYIPRTAVIKRINIIWINGNDASTEDTAISIRINNTTDYAIYTGSIGGWNSEINATGLSIPVTAGDYIHLKIVTPAYATNPLGSNIGGIIYLEC